VKVAKLEMKLIVALFVVGYDFDAVDSKGGLLKRLPVPDYNDLKLVSTLAWGIY
jgi:hypothetical protein